MRDRHSMWHAGCVQRSTIRWQHQQLDSDAVSGSKDCLVMLQAREAAEDEAARAAKALEQPKAVIRTAAREAFCNAAVDFDTRMQTQLSNVLGILEAPAAARDACLHASASGSEEAACWQKFVACREAADLRSWQAEAYASMPPSGL